MKQLPRILCIGGQDPTGGAGIQADIETVSALGGQALTLVTVLTAQDTRDIKSLLPTPSDFFASQMDLLINDIQPQAIKIGLIGSLELVARIQGLLQDFDGPVVLDPVLAAGGGYELDGVGLGEAMLSRLLPLTTLITPNRAEARRLSRLEDPQQAAAALLQAGSDAVLLTAADESDGEQVTNQLFTAGDAPRPYSWPRLPHQYHGSGCTLASACATRLALGDDLTTAVDRAQQFTWRSLQQAVPAGNGQWLPRRSA